MNLALDCLNQKPILIVLDAMMGTTIDFYELHFNHEMSTSLMLKLEIDR